MIGMRNKNHVNFVNVEIYYAFDDISNEKQLFLFWKYKSQRKFLFFCYL